MVGQPVASRSVSCGLSVVKVAGFAPIGHIGNRKSLAQGIADDCAASSTCLSGLLIEAAL